MKARSAVSLAELQQVASMDLGALTVQNTLSQMTDYTVLSK